MVQIGGYLIVVAAILGAAAFGALRIYSHVKPRTISVCAVTDVSFRLQRADWDHRIKTWFAEANRAFEASGVQWTVATGGDAYSEETEGNLKQRRYLIEESSPCAADVIVGFSGAPDPNVRSSSSPFGHVALIGIRETDLDAIAAGALASVLANLFAVPVNTEALIDTASPQGELLDSGATDLIRDLRSYDFARGTAALDGDWETRALQALERTLKQRSEQRPTVEAHRILARAFEGGRRYQQAAAQLQAAVRGAPRDVALRIEYALALKGDSSMDAAVGQMKEAAAIEPENAAPHALLGAFYRDQLRTYQAIEEFRIATRLDPTRPLYFTALSDVLSRQLGHTAEAKQALQTALRLNAQDRRTLHRRQALHLTAEILESRVNTARAAARANPNSIESRLELAYAEAQAGHSDDALASMSKVLAADPGNSKAHLAVARLHFDREEYAAASAALQAAEQHGAEIPNQFASAVRAKASTTRPGR